MSKRTKYTTIYGDDSDIEKLIDRIDGDIDRLMEECEIALDLFPNNLSVVVIILKNRKEVIRTYEERYKKKFNSCSFISLDANIIWISLADASRKVLGHEFAHYLLEMHTTKKHRIPYIINELIAQYCESKL